MPLRFRKTFKVAPGVKFTLGKKSAGISVGGKRGGLSLNSKSGLRGRVSAPGTGLSWQGKIGAKRPSGGSSAGAGVLGMVWAVFKWMFIIILWPVSLSVWFYRTPRFQLEPKRRALVLVCVWGGLLILGGILKLIQ